MSCACCGGGGGCSSHCSGSGVFHSAEKKRSGQTCHVPADTLLATDDSASTAMTVIRNQTVVTYNEVKEDTSGGDEAGCVQYDYARPTDVARGVMGLEPHNAVLLTPMYEPMSDAPCAPAKVSMNTCINTPVYMVATYIYRITLAVMLGV